MIRTVSHLYYSRVVISGRLIAKCARCFSAVCDQSAVKQALGLLDMYLDITGQNIGALKDPKTIAGFWGFLTKETDSNPGYLHLLVSKLRKVAHVIGLNVSQYSVLCGKNAHMKL